MRGHQATESPECSTEEGFAITSYETLVSRFSNIREMKVLPIQSRLSQVADLACTMKRISRRLEETGRLAKPESYFFGGEKNFRKNWIKSLLKNEWL